MTRPDVRIISFMIPIESHGMAINVKNGVLGIFFFFFFFMVLGRHRPMRTFLVETPLCSHT